MQLKNRDEIGLKFIMNSNRPLARVEEKSTIEISFKLFLADDEQTLVDETEGDERLKLTIGDGQFIKNLDDLFVGLELGTSAKFNLEPYQAYGEVNDERNQKNIQTMNRSDFPSQMTFSRGNVIAFDSPTGDEILGTVESANDETVEIDFNHPLAGKPLRFEFKIEKIF